MADEQDPPKADADKAAQRAKRLEEVQAEINRLVEEREKLLGGVEDDDE